ncbi:carbonic anhydrase [Lactarius indigo]|nr:carbonic anhydrase [Lactarius indigo]
MVTLEMPEKSIFFPVFHTSEVSYSLLKKVNDFPTASISSTRPSTRPHHIGRTARILIGKSVNERLTRITCELQAITCNFTLHSKESPQPYLRSLLLLLTISSESESCFYSIDSFDLFYFPSNHIGFLFPYLKPDLSVLLDVGFPHTHHCFRVAALPILAKLIQRAFAWAFALAFALAFVLASVVASVPKLEEPDATLAKIFSAHSRWAKSVKVADPTFFKKSAKGPQTPKVLWIGCSDSRVPESVITASRPGDIFVHRNIANQIHPDDDNAFAVITYAVAHVHVEHIFVVGHTRCGGADAALKTIAGAGEAEPVIERWLTPLISLARNLSSEASSDPLTRLIEENVHVQVKNVANSEPVRKVWEGKKDLWVHGLVYELETGRLRNLNITKGRKS